MRDRVVYVVEVRTGKRQVWTVDSAWEQRSDAQGEVDYGDGLPPSRVVEYVPREAVAEEREACAELAQSMIGASRREIAAAIRARGDA